MNLTNSTNSGVIVLLILMLAAWGLLAFDLYQIVSVPALGGEARYSRGWEMLWAFALTLATWFIMGFLLYRQHTPGGLLIGLLSGAAAFCALQLMDEGRSGWPAAILLALPLAITGTAFTRQWAAARVALIVISLIPCAVLAASTIRTSIGRSSQRRAIEKETREKNLVIVRTISENRPLWTWLPLVAEESGVRREALDAMRGLKRRQADVEQMFADDRDALDLVPELDLQPTPRLQQSINSRAVKDAAYARTMPGGGDEILERTFIYASLPAMHWLHSHGGDCHEGVSELKSAVLLYRDTPIRRRLLKELDALLGDGRP
jgi:hypothetical protein